MIDIDTTFETVYGVKECVQKMLQYGTPLEFYLDAEPKYIGSIENVEDVLSIKSLSRQEMISGQLNENMDIISQAESTHFLWDFKNRTLVYDFDTKERSTHFSIFPKFKEVFITALTMAPNGVVYINSNSNNLTSLLFSIHYFQFLVGSFDLKFKGIENAIRLIESVYGLQRCELYTYGVKDLIDLAPQFKMKSNSNIDPELTVDLERSLKGKKENTRQVLSGLIKTGVVPNTVEPSCIELDVNINSRITYMYILEGVLYVKIDEITEDDTLDSIMNAINIDDDRIVFYTDEFNPLDNDVENNWNNFGG